MGEEEIYELYRSGKFRVNFGQFRIETFDVKKCPFSKTIDLEDAKLIYEMCYNGKKKDCVRYPTAAVPK